MELHDDSCSIVLVGRNYQWKYLMIAVVSYWWVGLPVEIHDDSYSMVLVGGNYQWKYMMIAVVSYWWVGINSGNTR